MFDNLLKKLKKIKAEYLIVLLLATAILGVVFLTFFKDTDLSGEKTDTEKYINSLEEKLAGALSKVEGAGKVSVVITVSSGIKSDIAKEEKTVEESGKTITTSSPILVSGKPIVLTEVYPEIIGVLIVSKGADDIRVKMALLNAATTTLGVSCDKIQILNQ